MIINWHGKATSAGQVFCKRRFAPQSSPFWSHLSRLCKMQVLNKGLDMRYHAFFLRLTIAEFQILNTKKSETSEHQHGAYTCGHGRLYLKLIKMQYVMQTRLRHRTGSTLFCGSSCFVVIALAEDRNAARSNEASKGIPPCR